MGLCEELEVVGELGDTGEEEDEDSMEVEFELRAIHVQKGKTTFKNYINQAITYSARSALVPAKRVPRMAGKCTKGIKRMMSKALAAYWLPLKRKKGLNCLEG